MIVVLDWTKPWTFVDELETWLEWVEKWAKGNGARELEIVREENHERCKTFTWSDPREILTVRCSTGISAALRGTYSRPNTYDRHHVCDSVATWAGHTDEQRSGRAHHCCMHESRSY